MILHQIHILSPQLDLIVSESETPDTVLFKTCKENNSISIEEWREIKRFIEDYKFSWAGAPAPDEPVSKMTFNI